MIRLKLKIMVTVWVRITRITDRDWVRGFGGLGHITVNVRCKAVGVLMAVVNF